MSKFVEINDPAVHVAALTFARGRYQVNLLNGVESLSGSTLRGSARDWGAHYKESRTNLLERIQKAGLPVREEIRDHGRRVLVFG